MTYSISPWNLINSMKQVDKWTRTIQANINGATRIGYKHFDIYYGGGPTNILSQPSLVANGKLIAETFYNTAYTKIDFSQGDLITSDKWYHLAIDGEGFFMTTKKLSAPLPEDIQYTRDGEFYIDVDGLLRTKKGLYVLDGTSIPGDPNPSSTSVPPWAGSFFDQWQKREGLLIKNEFSYTLTAGTVVELSMDTQNLISQGFAQADLDDLRIGYWNGTTWSELPREIVTGTGNTTDTRIKFTLVNNVPSNTNVVGEYYVFYDNPSAGAPTSTTFSQPPLSKVKTLGNGVVAPNGPQDILDQMYLIVFRDKDGQYGLQYDKEFGGTYFEETASSGRPRALRPGVDGAGILKTSTLETSNVDMNKQITHLAAHSDVYDTLTEQLVVYLDTIQSSLTLFR